MQRLLILAVISFSIFITNSIQAQNKKTLREHNHFYKKLNLTEDQQKKIKNLRFDFKSKIQVLKENENLTEDTKKVEIKKVRQQYKTDIQKILTVDQQAQLKKLRENRSSSNNKNHKRNKLKHLRAQSVRERGYLLKDLSLGDV